MSDTTSVLDNLLPASFRGVQFWMPDTRITAGRRTAKFLFPGNDKANWQDLGQLDGPFSISGLMVGDDYVDQANNMLAAWRTAGSAILVHPWLGSLVVILKEPGTISFSQAQLRVARLEMTVELFNPTAPAAADTRSAVDDGVDDVQDQASGIIAAILAPATLTLAAFGAALAVADQVAGIYDSVVGTVGDVVNAVAGDISALEGVGDLVLGSTLAGDVAALLAAPAAAIALTSATLYTQAIGPGDIPPATAPQDPTATSTMLFTAAVQIAALAGANPGAAPGGPIALGAACMALASGVDASTDIVFTSGQDAQAWLVVELAAVDQVAALAVQLAPYMPAAAGQVWRSLQGMRGAVIADISAQIGRLPVVQTYTLAATVPAWLVAQALIGDTPAKLLAMYTDLVARNGVTYPWMMGPGSIEALAAAA
jgi:prophage DNA circulation protein